MLDKNEVLKDDVFFYNPKFWKGREFTCEFSLQLRLADYAKAYEFELPKCNETDKILLEKEEDKDIWLVAQNKVKIPCHKLLLKSIN